MIAFFQSLIARYITGTLIILINMQKVFHITSQPVNWKHTDMALICRWGIKKAKSMAVF